MEADKTKVFAAMPIEIKSLKAHLEIKAGTSTESIEMIGLGEDSQLETILAHCIDGVLVIEKGKIRRTTRRNVHIEGDAIGCAFIEGDNADVKLDFNDSVSRVHVNLPTVILTVPTGTIIKIVDVAGDIIVGDTMGDLTLDRKSPCGKTLVGRVRNCIVTAFGSTVDICITGSEATKTRVVASYNARVIIEAGTIEVLVVVASNKAIVESHGTTHHARLEGWQNSTIRAGNILSTPELQGDSPNISFQQIN